MTINSVLTDIAISIEELKKNPLSVVDESDGFPVAVIADDKPVFYCIPADKYEMLQDKLDDAELAQLVRERENSPCVSVNLDDL